MTNASKAPINAFVALHAINLVRAGTHSELFSS
jgi:hypothetical protein